MESEKLLSLVQQALERKNNMVFAYGELLKSGNNPEMLKILQYMLEKEQGHLEILRNIDESIRNGVDIPSHIYSMSAVAGNKGENFRSNLDLLMQSKAFSPQNEPQQDTRPSKNIRYANKTHVRRKSRDW